MQLPQRRRRTAARSPLPVASSVALEACHATKCC